MLKIFHMPVSENATNYLRVHNFKKVVEQQGLAEFFLYEKEMNGEMDDSTLKRLIQQSDLILAREMPTQLVLMVRQMFPRKRVVYDLDDNPWQVLPSSSGYQDLGINDIIHEDSVGSKKPLWVTGVTPNFNKYVNMFNLSQYDWLIRQADLVTASNPKLAELLSTDFNKDVVMVPFFIDFENYPDIEVVNRNKGENEYRIVWNGGSSHLQDLEEIRPAVTKLFKDDKDLTWINIGYWHTRFEDVIPENRLIKYGWTDTNKLPLVIKSEAPDVAVIPIQSIEHFNMYKAPMKFYEYAALRIPMVVKDSAPYNQVAKDGVNCLTYTDNKGLVKAIKRLKKNPRLARELADNAYYEVKKLSLQANAKNIIKVYEDFITSYKK